VVRSRACAVKALELARATGRERKSATGVISNLDRYQTIAPFYDLLDLPFERRCYHALRPLLFRGLAGRLLDAGVGTGRTFPFYPAGASAVVGIDLSPRMLARAEQRRDLSPISIELRQMDVTRLDFAANTFDAAVSTFLFCVLPDQLQVPALQELRQSRKARWTYPDSGICASTRTLRRIVSRIWEPWITFAYGASFDPRLSSVGGRQDAPLQGN
jgi:SAM-dependent methyltransferase